MKRIFYIAAIIPLFLISCEKQPRAQFSADPGDPVVGEEVWFTNESENADRFEWDFGDGYASNEANPVHTYTASASYEVTLKAWSSGGISDESYMTIDVKIPTLLEVEVLEYYEKYPVKDASVRLYPTLTDWDNETNMVNEGFTDADGIVVFSGLDNIVYYVDVWEQTHDNFTLRNEDVGFIRTSEIMPNKINRFIAYVDVADHGKGEDRHGRKMAIITPRRKAADMFQPGPASDQEGWKALYDKSVKRK